MSEESGGARLTAGVRVNLRIDNDHFDRLAGHHGAGQILKTDVVHCTVAADGHDRRAEVKFIVRKIVPVEVAEFLLLTFRVVFVLQQEFGKPDGLEAVRHLGHMSFENAHGHRDAVLKKMVGPWKRIRIKRISAAPDRRATGGVQHAHAGAPFPCGAMPVTPFEFVQFRDQSCRML